MGDGLTGKRLNSIAHLYIRTGKPKRKMKRNREKALGREWFTENRREIIPACRLAFHEIIAFGSGGCTSVVTMTAVANWFHKNVGIALGIMASGFGPAVFFKLLTAYCLLLSPGIPKTL